MTTSLDRKTVYEETLDYFNGDSLAADVWINKYCLKNKDGEFLELTPDDMHQRIASEFARIEQQFSNPVSKEEIYEAIKNFKYLVPQGSPMAGIGNTHQTISLGNCFVIGNTHDSYGGIVRIEEEMIHLMKRRGGVGTDVSHIRPKSLPVNNAAISSAGVVPFMERYSNATREVAQDGRRGALMLTCSDRSMNFEDFIDAKLNTTKVTGANISVKLSDEFMTAVEQDLSFVQQYPIDSENPQYTKEVNPRHLWKKIVHNSWRSAEPGILFWSHIIDESPADCYKDSGFETISTNPCVTGDTKVLIKHNGIFSEVTVKELYENFEKKTYYVMSNDIESKKNEVDLLVRVLLTKLDAEVIRLVFSNSHALKVTPDHKIFTLNRGWVEAQHITQEDRLLSFGFYKNYEISLVSKESILNEDVYDLTVLNNHNFFANGILIANCGEIGLSCWDSCRLLAMNLYSFVRDPFTEDAEFDLTLFRQQVRLAQRLMDDLCELENEKIDQILEKLINDVEPQEIKQVEINLWKKIKNTLLKGRRTGLGITAEADMLAALGLTYGSDAAIEMCEKVHKILATEALSSSIILAKERGAFPIWNYELEKNNPFLVRVLNEVTSDIKEDYLKYGRRNIAMMTAAPTGSVSLLTQTSGGIEPVFSLYYIRRRKINPNDKSARTDYIDALGDHWEEYKVFHPKFLTWAEIHGHKDSESLNHMNHHALEDLIKKSPYFNATASELVWTQRVKLQAQCQKWIDHEISSTINLPEHTTEEEVNEVLMAAWKYGCKGVTVYRDKCRSGVLVNAEENKINIFKENHAPKRPKILPCDIMRFVNKGEKWLGILGLFDHKPYELFTGPTDMVPIPSYVTKGEIIKEKNGDDKHIYHLRYIDRDGFTQEFKGLSRAFNREYWNIGRMVSAILRHGMPLPNVLSILDKLELDSNDLSSWKNGIRRMLKNYIKDGTAVKGEVCPECSSSQLVYKEGCLSCGSCGWTKCG